jgi:hypothetical protein
MSEDGRTENWRDRLYDPVLDELNFNGVSIGETWRFQTAIEDFLQEYARRVGLDEVRLKYTIGDRTGTRSSFLHLSHRLLFTREVVVGLQTDVLSKWPEWTVALAGYTREGDSALISAGSFTSNSEDIDDVAAFMQEFADAEIRHWERRYAPLERQKRYVAIQLRQNFAITEEQPFQVVAICEHWQRPYEYLGVWAIGVSATGGVRISVPGEESMEEGQQYAVSPSWKLLNYFASDENGTSRRESQYWVTQWLIPRDYQGRRLFAQRDSDQSQWTIPFDSSSIRMNSELQWIHVDFDDYEE